jgi:hypothetical protein
VAEANEIAVTVDSREDFHETAYSTHTFQPFRVSVVLLASLNGLAQKVTIDFDKGTDFSRPKTYAWIKGTPASNPKLDLYIMGVGDHQLEQKGLTKVEAKDADLLITYHAASHGEINTSSAGAELSSTTGAIQP